MDGRLSDRDLDEILPGLLEGRSRVYYPLRPRRPSFDLKLIGWLNRVRAQVRQGAQTAARISSNSATCSTNCVCSRTGTS
jgi:hypothetical protein